jgi:hypothetical protein
MNGAKRPSLLDQIDEQLALCEKATPGMGNLYLSHDARPHLIDIGEGLGAVEVHTFGHKTDRSNEQTANAVFMSEAIKHYPAALKALRVAVEALRYYQETRKMDGFVYPSNFKSDEVANRALADIAKLLGEKE